MHTTPEGLVSCVVQHGGSLDRACERLTRAIEAMGIPIFAIIDYKQNALAIHQTMHEARVIIFGNPEVGTALMHLPQKLLWIYRYAFL